MIKFLKKLLGMREIVRASWDSAYNYMTVEYSDGVTTTYFRERSNMDGDGVWYELPLMKRCRWGLGEKLDGFRVYCNKYHKSWPNAHR
jgi:hypothetical protein